MGGGGWEYIPHKNLYNTCVPPSPVVVSSRAAVSRAHIPNANISIAGVRVILSSKQKALILMKNTKKINRPFI